MKKNSKASKLFTQNPGPHNTVLNWNNVQEGEFSFYARAFHTAAKTLVENLALDQTARSDWDACPIVFLYRHALELHLKSIVLGDGSNILPTKPDPRSILKTHSLTRLAQIASQIVTAFEWESEFNCDGISNLSEFIAVIGELMKVDPGSHAFRYPVNTEGQGSVPSHLTFSVINFASRMDALLDLLDSIAFALDSEWGVRAEQAALSAEYH